MGSFIEDTGLFFERGKARANLLNHPGAIEDLTKAIERGVRSSDVYFLRGYAYVETKQFAQAVDDLDRAIALGPDAAAHFNRALARLGSGDRAGGLEDLNRSLELDPSQAEAWVNRGVAKAQQGDYEGAVVDFSRAASLGPDPNAPYGLGLSLSRLGRHEEAAQAFTRVLELKADHRYARFKRAHERMSLKDYAAAEGDLTAHLDRFPGEAEARFTRGLARYQLENYAAAVDDFNEGLKHSPKDGRAFLFRGRCRELLGDRGGAGDDYQIALQLGPDDITDQAREAIAALGN